MDRKRLFDSFLDALAIIGLAAMLILAVLFFLFHDTDGEGAETEATAVGDALPPDRSGGFPQ